MEASVEVVFEELERTLRTNGWAFIKEHLEKLAEGKLVALNNATSDFQLVKAAAEYAAFKQVVPQILGYYEVMRKQAQQ